MSDDARRLVADDPIISDCSTMPAACLRMQADIHQDAQLDRTVGVLGLGAIGAEVTTQLLRYGVARISGQDPRTIAGRLGPTIGAAFADRFEHDDRVTVHNGGFDEPGIAELVDSVDLIVAAVETHSPTLLHLVNGAAIAAGKPWLPVYLDDSDDLEMVVGPFVWPGVSPCYNEYEIQHEVSRALRGDYLLGKEAHDRIAVDETVRLLPSHAGLAASWAVAAALPYLVDGSSFLAGKAIRLDMARLEVTTERVVRLPDCPACSGSRPGHGHPFL
ncbi:TOMM precursor leader peptide-binding protein [Solihabitans fulvus]|uniref:TOMM leader peptide-binding protein n=1 Tax=Solihabitans fulvus TaxID=1892852 RepID=A0A5B2WXM6_9PSEU|nr:TOMM precursor leader peptide-binding protein [Solihabitans fulvus]KAA2255236.1 TOMM precursor leader peptide-binding protein [Solihabitans fulvus]